MGTEEPVLFFMPALIAVLLNAERTAGRPLTEAEVLKLRDSAVIITLPPSVADAMAKERGYEDIDPDQCWAQWQTARVDLVADG